MAKPTIAAKPLSGPQEKYCQLILAGKTQSDAYDETHPNSTPDNSRKNAPKWTTNDGIVSRIKELRDAIAEKVVVTEAYMVNYMHEAMELPICEIDHTHRLCQEKVVTSGPNGTTVRLKSVGKLDAAEKIIKMMGWNAPEKKQVEITDTLAQRIAGRNVEYLRLRDTARN